MQRPHFIPRGVRTRDWKAQKRAEMDEVLRAMRVFQSGCAFVPGYEAFDEARTALEALRRGPMSVSEWGR